MSDGSAFDAVMAAINKKARSSKKGKHNNAMVYAEEKISSFIDEFWIKWPTLSSDGQRAVYITDCSRHLMWKLRTIDPECRVDLLWADDMETDLSKLRLNGIRVYWSVFFQNKNSVKETSTFDVFSKMFDNELK